MPFPPLGGKTGFPSLPPQLALAAGPSPPPASLLHSTPSNASRPSRNPNRGRGGCGPPQGIWIQGTPPPTRTANLPAPRESVLLRLALELRMLGGSWPFLRLRPWASAPHGSLSMRGCQALGSLGAWSPPRPNSFLGHLPSHHGNPQPNYSGRRRQGGKEPA